MLVYLDEGEVTEIRRLASIRSTQGASLTDMKVDTRPGAEIDLEGLYGEWAVCKALGADPRQLDTDGPDPGWDVVHKDMFIQVKATRYANAHYIAGRSPDKFIADVGVLARVTMPRRVLLVGHITKEDFLDNYEMKSLARGGKPAAVVHQSILKPFAQLIT